MSRSVVTAGPAARHSAGPRRRLPTAVIAGLLVVLTAVAGYAGYRLWWDTPDWQQRAAEIPGIVDHRASVSRHPPRHLQGRLVYPVAPPVGGDHSPVWQNCDGEIYPEPLADEHAVHSLEHGAIWITYRPGLSAPEIDRLAQRVRGREYLFLSPYPGLTTAVSLQAWGYQLKVDSVDDPRIDRFVTALRMSAALETYAPCSGGTGEVGAAAVAGLTG